ncbi:hypothetical protein [Pseudomonas sp. NPDC087614]|uniref:hypothetical protein n=1 Tax=Pseudomonas sp. NPDC087614 TaxID=3364442 RepID=UPI003821BD11
MRDRIEALSNVSEQFAAVDQRFADLVAEFPDQLQTTRLGHVRTRVIEFKAHTDVRLADLLRNKHLLEPLPGPAKPTSSRKIISTRFKGTLVGERKKSTDGLDTELVEVRGELTGVIATFHEKSPGVWVEHGITKTQPAKARPNIKKAVEHAKALLDGLAAFHRRTEARIKRGQRIPVEIEEIYHEEAERLRKAGEALDEAMTAANLTVDPKHPTAALGHALSNAATALYEKGTSARIRIIKQQPPTAARVEWLKNKLEVQITQTVTRRSLKGQDKDFLDEYEVSDAKTAKVLWYAHFHYKNASDASALFTAGHMKTLQQRRLGGKLDLRNKSNQQLIEIYRSQIGSTLAQTLFFKPATPVADASVRL